MNSILDQGVSFYLELFICILTMFYLDKRIIKSPKRTFVGFLLEIISVLCVAFYISQ